jgi:hypothetical protein
MLCTPILRRSRQPVQKNPVLAVVPTRQRLTLTATQGGRTFAARSGLYPCMDAVAYVLRPRACGSVVSFCRQGTKPFTSLQ